MADVVGIRVQGITTMNNASYDWRKSITTLSFANTKSSIRNAAKGSGIEKELENLLNQADAKIDSLANTLLKFETELNALKSRYSKANSTSSSSISSSVKNINSLS